MTLCEMDHEVQPLQPTSDSVNASSISISSTSNISSSMSVDEISDPQLSPVPSCPEEDSQQLSPFSPLHQSVPHTRTRSLNDEDDHDIDTNMTSVTSRRLQFANNRRDTVPAMDLTDQDSIDSEVFEDGTDADVFEEEEEETVGDTLNISYKKPEDDAGVGNATPPPMNADLTTDHHAQVAGNPALEKDLVKMLRIIGDNLDGQIASKVKKTMVQTFISSAVNDFKRRLPTQVLSKNAVRGAFDVCLRMATEFQRL